MSNRFLRIHYPNKRLGQNFLHDTFIIDSIVSIIHPVPGENIIEIGPGLGALTESVIFRTNDVVIVIEIDKRLVNCLLSNSRLHSRIKIINKTVMNVDFSKISLKYNNNLRIFGSLPYNISVPLLFHLFKNIHIIRDMYFILQKEVADKLVAQPNSKNYGRLSIISQYYCNIKQILEVPSTSFYPIPKVRSVMVKMLPRTTFSVPIKNLDKFIFLTKLAFSHRRKMLRNSLQKIISPRTLREQGINDMLRAENLTVDQYCQLANIL